MFRKIKNILYRSFDEREIDYKMLKSLMKNEKVFLIDVRSSQEFKEKHLDGAINIPLYLIENEIENYVKNKSQKIILYCSSGNRSRQAKKILEKMQYKNVYNLTNGIEDII